MFSSHAKAPAESGTVRSGKLCDIFNPVANQYLTHSASMVKRKGKANDKSAIVRLSCVI